MIDFLNIAYVLVFFYALFVGLKFEWGEEGKDERGRNIISQSYRIIFPLLPIGWLALELYHDYIHQLSYEAYKLAIWYLLTGLYILHGIIITVLRRKF